jgi:hypothetical protein
LPFRLARPLPACGPALGPGGSIHPTSPDSKKKRRLGCRWAHWHFACWYVPSNLHVKGHQGALSAGRASFRDSGPTAACEAGLSGIQPQVPNGGPRLAATPRAPARPFRSPATRDLEAKSQSPCARPRAPAAPHTGDGGHRSVTVVIEYFGHSTRACGRILQRFDMRDCTR